MRSIQQGDDQIVKLVDVDDVKTLADAEKLPPTPLWVPKPVTRALSGDDFELQCIFAGNPTPSVTWKRRGGETVTAEASSSSSSSARFPRLTLADHGRILKIHRL